MKATLSAPPFPSPIFQPVPQTGKRIAIQKHLSAVAFRRQYSRLFTLIFAWMNCYGCNIIFISIKIFYFILLYFVRQPQPNQDYLTRITFPLSLIAFPDTSSPSAIQTKFPVSCKTPPILPSHAAPIAEV